MNRSEVVRAVRSSSVAEVAWIDAHGEPQVRGAVVLTHGDDLALALTYADLDVARSVAGAPAVTVSLTEPRSTGSGFRPLVAVGRPQLVPDPTGALFVEELLAEELRRYPPSRALADSPLLRREHWWYLPRLVVRIEVEAAQEAAARTTAADRVLAVAVAGRAVVQVVRGPAEDVAAERVPLVAAGERPLPAGPAALFGQDASFPDLEQWSQWAFHGAWDGAAFLVRRGPDRTGLEPRATLWQRVRRQRRLERRCRANLPR